MKKIFPFIMTFAMMLSLTACGGGDNAGEPSRDREPETAVQTMTEQSGTKEDANETEPSSDMQESVQTEDPGGSPQEETQRTGTKALVVYFSATGNTKAVAETLAGLQNADIYEIIPEQPYTDKDLNYNDRTTRATAEQNDPDARPAIQGSITDFEQYEVVYVGYPIWWGDMPRILYTFFDTYDFSGKTIAPFCTSGGSGLSGTPGTIAELEPEAQIVEGLSVHDTGGNSLTDDIAKWLESNGINGSGR